MEPSAARDVAQSYLMSSMDVAILMAALFVSCASLLIVYISLRRLKRVARLLAHAQDLVAERQSNLPRADLQRAIEAGEFELLFQPEGSFGTLEIPVAEALLRWRRPDGRYWSPGEFLFVAEQSGMISEISDWVLKCAINTVAKWRRGPWPNARVAVNVSPRQLLDHSFVDRVSRLLDAAEVSPDCLEIELTENVIQTGLTTIQALQRLRALGVSVALDDFGTGFSSLSSLEALPLTRVKIDRSLIASVDSNPRAAAIVRSIITLCDNLGLHVTAEGVERPEQLARLLSNTEVHVQGYLLARPMTAADFERFLPTAHAHMQELLLQSFEHMQASHPETVRYSRPQWVMENTP
jgi:EAL domain-containing protein (putative c-di-GMP-specific phosphodiesterase class I)